jgi:glycopeptide antibiotics resistance protein
VPVVMLLLATVCVVVGFLVVRRRPVLWALVGLSTVPVVALTLVPTPGRSFVFCVVQFDVPSLRTVEPLANLALLFPLLFFAALATRRPLLMLVAGVVLSAAIETFQGLVPALGRACDTNDWAMNSTGVVVSVLLAGATIALTNRRLSTPVDNPVDDSNARSPRELSTPVDKVGDESNGRS